VVRLEIYVNDMDRDPMASVVCNVVPRVDERITLLDGEGIDSRSGRYRVLGVDHILDERFIESVQHVCLIVMREAT
jgi:hypothetical protein